MAQKIGDLAVKVGSYEKNGETKGRYENVGVVMQGENGQFIMLKRTFNPAGVPNPDNRESVLVSVFEPRSQVAGNTGVPPGQQDYGRQGRQQPATRQQYQQASQASPRPPHDGAGAHDDDVPF